MFDLSWTELLLIAVVALVAIGPKELPRVLYEAGKWVRRARLMAGEFQRHFSDMMHEAELDELRRQAMAARDLTRPMSLAELVDPGGSMRREFDPTGSGTAGYTPPDESAADAVPAEAVVPPVAAAPEPPAAEPVAAEPDVAAPDTSDAKQG